MRNSVMSAFDIADDIKHHCVELSPLHWVFSVSMDDGRSS
jgi:hypothetical protein